MEEEVLVVPREVFVQVGYFQGFCREVERYLPAFLSPGNCFFLPRAQVENDPSYKQLIPYVLFRYRSYREGDMLFQYIRGPGQGEKRLHSKRSVGVGGHICRRDMAGENPEQIYREGLRRELFEEVVLNTSWTEKCVGLINDDLTEVGRVHLGVVHVFEVDRPEVYPSEPDLWEGSFRPVGQLLAELPTFETWSQICLLALFADTPLHQASAQPR
jgi:predicted NUDIX family phosphoesterase